MSQRERLQEHFLSGKTITRLTAYEDLGIFELSSRVGELEAGGCVIPRKNMTITNRWNEKVRVTLYWMEV
jgi:hypothetical protein